MSGLQRFVAQPETAGPLQRFARPRPRPATACELCAVELASDHRHLVDLRRRSLVCTCRACGLRFDGPSAARGQYRLVPERYVRISPFALTPRQWNALQIPVGLAFFMRTSPDQPGDADGARTVAFYPSPAGATESELVLEAWEEVTIANPALTEVADDTEAALVRFRVAEPDCFVVPVDRCYELVGRLRTKWRGFDGGAEVADALNAFFDDVRARSRRVAGGVTP